MAAFVLVILGACCPALAGASPASTVSPPDRPEVSGLAAGLDLTSPEALGWSPEQHRAARRYSRDRWTLAFVSPLWEMGTLALLVFTGAAGRAARWLAERVRRPAATDALFILGMVGALAALNFPLEVYRYLRERRYGFAVQAPADWLADELKGLVVACVIAVAFLVPVWAIIRRWPRSWWVIGSGVGVAFSILLIAVAPVFIAPLFNTFTPLRDASLAGKILEMAHRHGIPAEHVYEVDASRQSRHDNAYVVGLLGTQRIVLYDTLLSAYSPEEIQFVMGHEMGHYVLSHVWKGVAVASAAVLAGFLLAHRTLFRLVARHAPRLGYDAPGSIAAVPLALLLFSAYLFAITPISSAVSRHFERQADAFGLEAIADLPGAPGVAVSSFQKMASRNLSDPDPPAFVEWWLYSHPSIGRRIRAAAGK